MDWSEVVPNLLVALASASLAFLGNIFYRWLSTRVTTYGLKWVVVSSREAVPRDKIIETTKTRSRFILHNSGTTPIVKEDIYEPLRWHGSVESSRVVKTNPRVTLELKKEEHSVEIFWRLFNQRCMALIEINHSDDNVTADGEISYQIKNIPEIEVKNITAERAILKWFRILNHGVTRIAVILAALVFSALLYMGDETIGSWLFVGAPPLSILLGQYLGWYVVLFVRVKRNPYSKLMATD